MRSCYKRMTPNKEKKGEKGDPASQDSPDEPSDKKGVQNYDVDISLDDSPRPERQIGRSHDADIGVTDAEKTVPQSVDEQLYLPGPESLTPAQGPIRKAVFYSLRDSRSARSYCDYVYLQEDPQGELKVILHESGMIIGVPKGDYCNESTLNELFRACFEHDAVRWPNEKKFLIKCKKPVILQRDSQGVRVREKGILTVEPSQ